jgi:hypothetical protein
VLETNAKPSQWNLKYSQPTNEQIQVDNAQFCNQLGQCFLKKVDTLIRAAILDEALQIDLGRAISLYTEGMSLITLHRNLSDEEKEHFQDLLDEFFNSWIELFGVDGISNYIHMLGSGHVLYFIKKYNCLYLYSQQGWEALNNRIRAYIQQNSGRDGKNTGVNGDQSYIFPLVCFILHDLLWKNRGSKSFFFSENEKEE